MRNHGRWGWARFNVYGIVLAVLAVMGVADLIHPADAELATVVGRPPPGQTFWVASYVIAGLLLLAGFLRTDRIAESLGLGLLTLGLAVETVVGLSILGWTEYSLTRIILLVVIGGCTWARLSVLWSRHGLTIQIPPRGEP